MLIQREDYSFKFKKKKKSQLQLDFVLGVLILKPLALREVYY